MKNQKIYILLFLFIINISLCLAVQPTILIPISDNALDLRVSMPEIFKQNEPLNVYIHAFNSSNLMPITTGATCYLHIYGYPKGEHIGKFFDNAVSNGFDYEMEIPSSNLSILGYHQWIVQCNLSNSGGSTYGVIEITKTGNKLEVQESLIYILLSGSIFFLLLVSGYFMFTLPYNNKRNGEFWYIPRTKYLKLGLILITYALTIWFLNILLGLSNNYLTLTMYYGFISFLFNLLTDLSYILFVIIIVLSAYNLFKDMNLFKLNKSLGFGK